MKLKRPVKLKITGLGTDVEAYIRDQENQYIIARTSAVIPHQENDEVHAYVMIIPEAR